MNEAVAAAGAAWWFGFLTSISPCLLATNVAAILRALEANDWGAGRTLREQRERLG